jgi:hypothetical protein
MLKYIIALFAIGMVGLALDAFGGLSIPAIAVQAVFATAMILVLVNVMGENEHPKL